MDEEEPYEVIVPLILLEAETIYSQLDRTSLIIIPASRFRILAAARHNWEAHLKCVAQ